MTLIDKADALAAIEAWFAETKSFAPPSLLEAIAALPARGVGVPTEVDREWIEVRADELFLENERLRGSVRLGTIRPQDFRDYFLVDATLEWFAALAPTDAAQDDDPECTGCGGTGITYQTERVCACQPTDAAQAREAAARLLLDMLYMRNGAHEGVSKEDAQAMWDAASTREGYAAVDAFLRSIISEART